MGATSAWKAPPGWAKTRQRVFARYGHVCWRCGGYAGTVDHVIPVVLGGSHDMSNLRPSCAFHNSSAGASVGNRLRPFRPLTVAQRRAIGRKRAQPGQWPTSRTW